MFNPFNGDVMRAFLLNNIDILRKTKSVIGYANCKELDAIREFCPEIILEISDYRCAVIYF